MTGQIPKTHIPTIGVEVFSKVITLKDGQKVKAQMWDTAGQERYRAITSNHFRKSVGALLVFDITNASSFSHLENWLDDIKSASDPDIVIILVGNKVDLNRSRKVSQQEATDFATQNKMIYLEVSAHTGESIDKCFDTLFQGIEQSYIYKIKEICKQKSGYRGGEQSQLKLMRQFDEQKRECKC